MIEFKRKRVAYPILNPKTKEIEYKVIEVRRDPITNEISIINPERKKKRENYKDQSFCPFCKENLEISTPLFPEGKRYFRGRSVIIPNYHPYSEVHGILIPNYESHITNIRELDFLDFYNSIKLAIDFFKKNFERDKNKIYVSINLNHGILAGASISHLHFHLIQNSFPTTYQKKIIKVCKKYFEKNRKYLFEDLVKIEKEKRRRFIKEEKIISWIASFAPKGDYDVLGVVKSFGIVNMAESNLYNFSKELYNFLIKYSEISNIFNLSIIDFSFIKIPGLNPLIRVVSRAQYGFMESIHSTYVSSIYPEEIPKLFKEKL